MADKKNTKQTGGREKYIKHVGTEYGLPKFPKYEDAVKQSMAKKKGK